MDRSDVLTLISVSYTQDEYMQEIPTETSRDVFCETQSISHDEWFEAGRDGLRPEYSFTVFRYDYNGEPYVEYRGNRYAIYRTYEAKNETIELYVESKVGVFEQKNNQTSGFGKSS